MGPYATKEKAEKSLRYHLNQLSYIGYCPLRRGTCKSQCVCFNAPRVQHNTGGWYAYGAYCSSPLITGGIQVYGLN